MLLLSASVYLDNTALRSPKVRFYMLRFPPTYDLPCWFANMVHADVFERSKDKDGELKGDVQGFLGLYEASFLGFEGENLLDEAS